MLDLFNNIEGITETFVPLRKQGKMSRKKKLSKETIGKIAQRQMLWRMHKEILDLVTNEVRK